MIEETRPFTALLASAFQEFLDEHNSMEAYRQFLYNTYCYVRHTVPTIMSVAEKCHSHPLSHRLIGKAEEEVGHDVMFWKDLLVVGVPTIPLLSPFVSQFVDLEMATAHSSDPVSMLYGDFLVLECNAPVPAAVDRLVTHFSLPAGAATAARLHAELDGDEHSVEIAKDLLHPSINRKVVADRAIVVTRLFISHWKWMKERTF